MQLRNMNKSVGNIKESFALAATTLLGCTVQAQNSASEAEWDFSASALLYSEPDRVNAVEFIVDGNKNFSDTSNFDFKIVLDSLTGASANGAIEQTVVQTMTRPSGIGQFETPANSAPLDDTFHDTRVQANLSWTDALTDESRYTIGTNLSKEYDYQSISLNAEIAKDFNQKNSTLSVGLSFGTDELSPEGRIPVGFSSMVVNSGQFSSEQAYWEAFNLTRNKSSDTITTAELLLGWTQIVNRRMIFQLNYGFADTGGYLTDPFKVLSVVDNNGITQDLVYESRPDNRTQHSVYGLIKYHFDNSIFDVSYRYLTDDWEIQSHTIDTHWRILGENGSFWEPHLRWYQQSAADFYSPFLLLSNSQPEFASADYRVGDMDGITVGLKYGFQMSDGDSAEIRLEYYKQTPNAANQPLGSENMQGVDLYPKVDALILQFNYYF